MWLYFHAKELQFPTERAKIGFALSYLRDCSAGPWANLIIEQLEKSEENGTPPLYHSFVDLAQDF